MSDKWRKTAKKLMGQPVVVRHQNGHTTHGILRQADERGVYVQPMHGGHYASVMKQNAQVAQAVATETDTVETEHVFFGAWFLILYALIGGLFAFGAGGFGGGYGYGRGYGGGYGGVARPYGRAPYGQRRVY
ncbi:hypothetical protein [Tumebacillus permanentifrigoris]|uniref:Uncharacterized protein n=1 Tax=Tumebacillus permanentifrigoris TaxID=378543 RepID=A0A316D762_9BACL|nr:hypothetical protein [Tumebacillus permanentifrigoris]PWK11564.1 hypothetical protein C7459_11093 [Tumebacillus permanentifrigoris]